MNLTSIYEQSSGVNLEEQKRIWDKNGKGRYGEYLVFSKIFPLCSDQAKILTNVRVPIDGHTAEIDVLLIDTFGLVSFEVKHFKGTIYGNSADATWTQYFKTAKNEHFKSPILQNDYHIQALRKWFPNCPIYSTVVFTNPTVVLKVANTRLDVRVCRLDQLNALVLPTPNALTEQGIDSIFQTCLPWSPTQENTVSDNGKVVPFCDYLRSIVTETRNTEQAKWISLQTEEKAKWAKKVSPLSIVLIAVGAVLMTVGLIATILGYRKYQEGQKYYYQADGAAQEMQRQVEKAESKASEAQAHFDRYFSKATWNNDGNLNLAEDFIAVSDVRLEKVTDLEKGTLLQFTIHCEGTEFVLHFNQGNELVLLLKDGRSVSGAIRDFTDKYVDQYLGAPRSVIQPEYATPEFLIAGVDPEEIEYIKVVGAEIVKAESISKTAMTGVEFEVFNNGK